MWPRSSVTASPQGFGVLSSGSRVSRSRARSAGSPPDRPRSCSAVSTQAVTHVSLGQSTCMILLRLLEPPEACDGSSNVLLPVHFSRLRLPPCHLEFKGIGDVDSELFQREQHAAGADHRVDNGIGAGSRLGMCWACAVVLVRRFGDREQHPTLWLEDSGHLGSVGASRLRLDLMLVDECVDDQVDAARCRWEAVPEIVHKKLWCPVLTREPSASPFDGPGRAIECGHCEPVIDQIRGVPSSSAPYVKTTHRRGRLTF
jgi:hypothetical protein